MAGRLELITEIKKRGITIGIATNQAGVAFTKSDQRRIEEKDVYAKIDKVVADLGLATTGYHLAVSFAHPYSPIAKYRDVVEVCRRKPSGEMIRELMIEVALDPTSFTDRAKVLMIGDREEDAAAAMDAGVASLSSADVFSTTESGLPPKQKRDTPENMLIFKASDLGQSGRSGQAGRPGQKKRK